MLSSCLFVTWWISEMRRLCWAVACVWHDESVKWDIYVEQLPVCDMMNQWNETSMLSSCLFVTWWISEIRRLCWAVACLCLDESVKWDVYVEQMSVCDMMNRWNKTSMLSSCLFVAWGISEIRRLCWAVACLWHDESVKWDVYVEQLPVCDMMNQWNKTSILSSCLLVTWWISEIRRLCWAVVCLWHDESVKWDVYVEQLPVCDMMNQWNETSMLSSCLCVTWWISEMRHLCWAVACLCHDESVKWDVYVEELSALDMMNQWNETSMLSSCLCVTWWISEMRRLCWAVACVWHDESVNKTSMLSSCLFVIWWIS